MFQERTAAWTAASRVWCEGVGCRGATMGYQCALVVVWCRVMPHNVHSLRCAARTPLLAYSVQATRNSVQATRNHAFLHWLTLLLYADWHLDILRLSYSILDFGRFSQKDCRHCRPRNSYFWSSHAGSEREVWSYPSLLPESKRAKVL